MKNKKIKPKVGARKGPGTEKIRIKTGEKTYAELLRDVQDIHKSAKCENENAKQNERGET